MSLIEAVGEPLQGAGDRAHGGDGFAADLRDNGIVDVSDGVAQLQLDELHSFFDALSDAAGGRAGRRRCTHEVPPSALGAGSALVCDWGEGESMGAGEKVPQWSTGIPSVEEEGRAACDEERGVTS